MTPEAKRKLKKYVEPAKQVTQWTAIITILINGFFDTQKDRIATNTETIKMMLQNEILLQSKTEARVDKILAHDQEYESFANNEICHLWENKVDKYNSRHNN